MKKSPIWAVALLLLCGQMWAQCVFTCSNYLTSPITYSVFPYGSVNVAPSFTGFGGASNVDDGDYGPISIGFNFTYYCNTYTDVYIASNGFISFDPIVWAGPYLHPTTVIPNPAQPNNMISFNSTDLFPDANSVVTYTTIGSAPNRMFVVTFSNVPNFTTNTDRNYGQIVLFESSNIIEIHTGEAHGDSNQSGNGSQGIEDSQGLNGVPVPGRSNSGTWYPATNTAFRFTPEGPSPPTGLIGTTVVCQNETGNYLLNASPGATAYTWYIPGTWSGTSNTTTATFTAGASGELSVSASYTCGTSTPITISVTVNPAPVISIVSATPQLMCSGSTMTFDLSGAATYTILPGGTNGSSPLMTMPMTSTNYSVIGTSLDGCESLFSPQVNVTVNETPTVVVSSGSICLGDSYQIQATGAASYNISSGFFQVTPSTTGSHNFTVTGMALNGCISGPVISTVLVNEIPEVNISASNTLVCRKDEAVLTATGASTYSWTHTTNSSNMITITPSVLTTYSVTGTSTEGCKKTSAITISVSACNGISEFDALTLDFYPNPAGDKITVRSASGANMTIADLHGRVLLSSELTAGDNEIKLDNLPAGCYFIQAESAGKNYKGTLIRQ